MFSAVPGARSCKFTFGFLYRKYWKRKVGTQVSQCLYSWLIARVSVVLRTVYGCYWRFDILCGVVFSDRDDFHTGCRTSVTTNNSPSQDYTSPTQWLWRSLPHRLSKRQSQPTTVLLRTTQADPMTLKITSTQVVQTSVTTNNSPSQDYTSPTNDSEDHFHTGCPNVSHNQQQSFSVIHKPDPMTLKMTSTQVVETSVTTNNSPSQDYTNPTQWLWRWLPHRLSKRQSQPTIVLLRTTSTWTINQLQTQKILKTMCTNVIRLRNKHTVTGADRIRNGTRHGMWQWEVTCSVLWNQLQPNTA